MLLPVYVLLLYAAWRSGKRALIAEKGIHWSFVVCLVFSCCTPRLSLKVLFLGILLHFYFAAQLHSKSFLLQQVFGWIFGAAMLLSAGRLEPRKTEHDKLIERVWQNPEMASEEEMREFDRYFGIPPYDDGMGTDD